MDVKDPPVCFQNTTPNGRKYTCPWCGKLIIAEDATLTMLHQAPVCARFSAEAARGGATVTGLLVVRS